jgi:hypothetical protein
MWRRLDNRSPRILKIDQETELALRAFGGSDDGISRSLHDFGHKPRDP